MIDVNSIPKSNHIKLEAVEEPEAVQKCHVLSHTGECAQISEDGLSLQEKLVDDDSCNSLFVFS